jgi:hypothetical protein
MATEQTMATSAEGVQVYSRLKQVWRSGLEASANAVLNNCMILNALTQAPKSERWRNATVKVIDSSATHMQDGSELHDLVHELTEENGLVHSKDLARALFASRIARQSLFRTESAQHDAIEAMPNIRRLITASKVVADRMGSNPQERHRGDRQELAERS